MFTSLTSHQLNELVTSNTATVKFTTYSREDYLEAIERLQLKTYLPADKCWGLRWKQKLSNCLPFILKLLYKGYNNFLVFPISSHNSSWFNYSFEEFEKYAKHANVPTSIYSGWYAQKPASKEWHHYSPFIDTCIREDNNKRVSRYIQYLAEVGAITKVQNAYVNLTAHYLYSSKYIVSKDKLRELVSLFLHSFYTSLHTTLYSSSSILTTSSSSSTSIIPYISSLPTLGDMKGGVCQNDTVALLQKDVVIRQIRRNNEVLPEEEQMRANGRRIYSEVCSYVNEEKHKEIATGQMTRQMYLDSVFGHDKWFEFDRRGSIYNITYTLNKHKYLDNNDDIYELMNGRKFTSKEERDLYKMTQMSIYFSTGRRTVNYFIRNLTRKAELGFIPEEDNKLINAYWKLCNCDENTSWNEFIDRFYKHYNMRKKLMKKFIGDNKWLIDEGSKFRRSTYVRNEESFIFQYESLIYLNFVSKLRERGIRVVQVYDGFYFQNGSITEDELNNLMKNTFLEFHA